MPRHVPAPAHRWLTLAAVSLTQLLLVLDGTVVNIALPSAQAELGMSDGSRQWVVTAYALAFGSFLLLGGRVADFWGRKRTYLLGLAAFGLGSAWGGWAQTPGELLAARGVQGLAAAFMAPAALAYVTLTFPDGPERTRAFAIFGSLAGVGSAVGMLLGGVLTEFGSWRWCMLINVPFVAAGLVAGTVLLRESRAEGPRRYDIAGALTATLGFGALVYGLTLGETSWTAPLTVACLAAGPALLVCFVLIERRSASPLLPLRVLTNPTRAAAFIVQLLFGAAGIGGMVYLTLYLQLVLHLPPLLAGLGTLPFTVSLMGTVPFAIRLMDRVGPRRQLVFGPLISATGMALLSRVIGLGSYAFVLPGIVLLGVGLGFTAVPLSNLALHGVDPADAGVASATSTATNQLGGSVGLAALTALFVSVQVGAGAGVEGVVAGTSAVFIVGACVYVVAALVSWTLVRPRVAAGAKLPSALAPAID